MPIPCELSGGPRGAAAAQRQGQGQGRSQPQPAAAHLPGPPVDPLTLTGRGSLPVPGCHSPVAVSPARGRPQTLPLASVGAARSIASPAATQCGAFKPYSVASTTTPGCTCYHAASGIKYTIMPDSVVDYQ